MATIDPGPLEEELDAYSKEQALEAANRWFSRANEVLIEGGDEHEYETFPVAQSGVPPRWVDDAYEFRFPHVAAKFFNSGTAPHEVSAKRAQALAFEWPDAPKWVREEFSETFPLVFMPRTNVEGIEALRFMEKGKQDAERWLQMQ